MPSSCSGKISPPQPLILPHPSAKKNLLTGAPLPASLRPAQVVAYAIFDPALPENSRLMPPNAPKGRF